GSLFLAYCAGACGRNGGLVHLPPPCLSARHSHFQHTQFGNSFSGVSASGRLLRSPWNVTGRSETAHIILTSNDERIDDRTDQRRSFTACITRDRTPERLDIDVVLKRDAHHHADVTRDVRDVCPGFADADEHFAERVVLVKAGCDRDHLVAEQQVECFG